MVCATACTQTTFKPSSVDIATGLGTDTKRAACLRPLASIVMIIASAILVAAITLAITLMPVFDAVIGPSIGFGMTISCAILANAISAIVRHFVNIKSRPVHTAAKSTVTLSKNSESPTTKRALTPSHKPNANELQIAILGLGGRVQGLLTECVQLTQENGKTIRVVAICDDHAQSSYEFFIKNSLPKRLLSDYSRMFESKALYRDTQEGIEALFRDHPNLDRIFICSPNDRHAVHLNAALAQSACKTIYLEKPLFRTLEDFEHFNHDLRGRVIHVGLTLRYALITKLVSENLRKYQPMLGKLKKVHSWEHVNFGHGLSIIMMNWRRYRSLSGGLLLDKSVHDLDLALFFMEALGVRPKSFSISTTAEHNFYKKSNKNAILNKLLTDHVLQKNAEKWDRIPWQRKIPFAYDSQGKIDWKNTLENFFKDFPENDDFSSSDIIPDTHFVSSKISTNTGDVIDYKLDLKLNGLATKTERGCQLTFENGSVKVDMESSKMVIQMLDRSTPLEFDLNTRNIPHAGGDVYVAHTVLGTLPKGNLSAEFTNPSVQMSTVMGLISEYQAQNHIQQPMHAVMTDERWKVDLSHSRM